MMLWWLAAAAVPVGLYLFRHRPQRRRVSTLLFFKSLSREHQESAWLRRLKRLLSLALSLLVIAAAAAALARLIVAPPADEAQNLVILVDRSASMAAVDGGATRLERGIGEIQRRLAGVPASVPVSVVAYDRRAEILLPRSTERRDIRRSLESIEVRPIEADAEPAMELAQQLAAIAMPAEVWHVTDAPAASQRDGRDEKITTRWFDVAGGRASNAGITGFALRRSPMERDTFQAFVQLHASGERPVESKLELRLDDQLVGLRTFELKPGEAKRFLTPIKAGDGAVLSLRLVSSGDALPLDDQVWARVPPAEPMRVLWIAPEPDPFTGLALSSLGTDKQVRVLQGKPDAWPAAEVAGEFDVVLFEGWLPERWPERVPVIAIDPPGALGPVTVRRLTEGGLPLDAVRPTDERHALLYGVASGRLMLTQTSVMDADVNTGGLEPLWIGPSGPVLAAGDVRGQRVVAMAFSPMASESLPLTSSYPMLLGNAVYWCTQPREARELGDNLRTGELLEIAEADAAFAWQGDDAGGEEGDDPETAPQRWVELDRVGLWTAGERTGSAALLSPGETLLQTAGGAEAAGASSWGFGLAGDLMGPLLWVIVGTLVLESYLFHRRSVY